MAAILTYAGAGTAKNTPADPATWTALPIGTAAADRYVVVCVSGGDDAGVTGGTGLDAAVGTIGGAAMTRVASRNQGTVSGNAQNGVAIFVSNAPVVAGTTADFVLSGWTETGTDDINAYGYALTGAANPTTPFDSVAASGASTTAVDVPANGCAVGIYSRQTEAALAWTTLVEDADADVGELQITVAHLNTVGALTGPTIATDGSGGVHQIAVVSWAAGNNAYSLVCSVGSFVLTGIAALFPITRKVIADVGSFTLSGVAATLKSSRLMAAAVGSFTLSGIDAILKAGKGLIAEAGSFAFTGSNALFHVTLSIAAAVGTFVFSGVNALFPVARKVAAAAGSFTLTGIDIIMTIALRMLAAVGSFTLTGIDAILKSARSMAAAVGSFTLTGVAIQVSFARKVFAETGVFVLGGIAALLARTIQGASAYLKRRNQEFVLQKARVVEASLSVRRASEAVLQKTRVHAASLSLRRSVSFVLRKSRTRDPQLGE